MKERKKHPNYTLTKDQAKTIRTAKHKLRQEKLLKKGKGIFAKTGVKNEN